MNNFLCGNFIKSPKILFCSGGFHLHTPLKEVNVIYPNLIEPSFKI